MGNRVAEGWWRGGRDCNHIEIGVGRCGIVFDQWRNMKARIEQPSVVAVGEGYLGGRRVKQGSAAAQGKGVNTPSRQRPASFIHA